MRLPAAHCSSVSTALDDTKDITEGLQPLELLLDSTRTSAWPPVKSPGREAVHERNSSTASAQSDIRATYIDGQRRVRGGRIERGAEAIGCTHGGAEMVTSIRPHATGWSRRGRDHRSRLGAFAASGVAGDEGAEAAQVAAQAVLEPPAQDWAGEAGDGVWFEFDVVGEHRGVGVCRRG